MGSVFFYLFFVPRIVIALLEHCVFLLTLYKHYRLIGNIEGKSQELLKFGMWEVLYIN